MELDDSIILEKPRKVSILIPAYNAEQYIAMCLNSVVNQTYDNLEILVVNDGSTDNTAAILESYARADARIKVFNCTNSGVSKARNLLLANFTGDYVCFLDSDDLLPDDSIGKLVSILEENRADMATGAYYRKKGKKTKKSNPGKVTTFSGRTFTDKMLRPAGFFCYPWGRLFVAAKITGLSFPTDYFFEDVFSMPKIVMKCEKVVRTNQYIYFYRKNPTSTTRRTFSRMATDEMDGYVSCFKLGFDEDDFILARNSIVFFLTKYYWYSLKVIFNGLGIGEFRQKYRKYVGWFWKQLLKGDFIEDRALLENRLEPWR